MQGVYSVAWGRAGLVHRVRAWCMQGVDSVGTGRAGAPGESLVHAECRVLIMWGRAGLVQPVLAWCTSLVHCTRLTPGVRQANA